MITLLNPPKKDSRKVEDYPGQRPCTLSQALPLHAPSQSFFHILHTLRNPCISSHVPFTIPLNPCHSRSCFYKRESGFRQHSDCDALCQLKHILHSGTKDTHMISSLKFHRPSPGFGDRKFPIGLMKFSASATAGRGNLSLGSCVTVTVEQFSP